MISRYKFNYHEKAIYLLSCTVLKMVTAAALVFSVLSGLVAGDQLAFPPGFKFGAATSAYQVEGSWNVTDKGVSIWDTFTHRHDSSVFNQNTGDVACDSYTHYKRDVQMAEEMGLQFYRFSLSWPRLLPTGFSNRISEDGKRYYNELIDELLRNGIEPMVTIYHWDLPQTIQNLGGWTNPLIVDWFGDYARNVYSLFGDRVKTWITINEPLIACDLSYNTGLLAPGIVSPGLGSYLCNKHVMLAHATAYRIYDEEFRVWQNGKVSFTNQLIWTEGDTEHDETDAEIMRQFMIGLCSHPVYSAEGGWPRIIEELVAEKSISEGYKNSKLPVFSSEEIEFIRGTFDFYSLNYYTARTVRRARAGEVVGPYPLFGAPDLDLVLGIRPHWKESHSASFQIYPEGLRHILTWLKKNYGDLEFFILENGFASKPGLELQDDERIQFIHDHLEQVLLSIYEDGADVRGYTAWSIMDNFEWHDGYNIAFGLYAVDFNDPQRTRTPRKSAKYYERVIKSHSLVPVGAVKDDL
ncbi:myrosinase 1-like [Plodia interpunctella]|uniref:myrosinase 1-like n=1 Tax=Plodia interpunctella TaxID=58824 RepID=UPI002367E77E|nr:myrosinase 1-like [Plodia interpunctella]